MPTKIQGGLGIDKVQDGTVGMSSTDTELYGKINALTTINLGEAKTATGTVVDFDVPLGVKRVTVMFDGVSTNGSSNVLVRVGSGFIELTGYISGGANLAAASGSTATQSATGFLVQGTNAATIIMHGSAILSLMKPNTWVFNSILGRSDAGTLLLGGGSKTLSDNLAKLRITTVNGTDLFDAGTINISWEF